MKREKKSKQSAIFIMLLAVLAFWVAMMPATSAAWEPSKPMAIVVGSSPGGGNDSAARYLSYLLPEFLGKKQPVIVVNMPGAANRLALNLVRRSNPDGLTIGLIEGGRMSSLAAYGLIDYDPSREFTMLGGIWTAPATAIIVSSHPSVRPSPQQTWEELKKLKRPVRIASYGNEGEFCIIPVFEKFKIPYIIVPGYGGFSDARGGLIRGEADVVTGAATKVVLQYVENGECAPLLVVSEGRYKGVPDLGIISLETTPTVAELGFPDLGKFSMSRSRMFYTAKNLPADIEKTLSGSIKKVLDDPRTLQWAKKTSVPMMWVDKKPLRDAYPIGVATYKRYTDIARKIGLTK